VFLKDFHNWLDKLSRPKIFLILIFLGLLAYANAVNHPFVHDDVVFIPQNPHISDLNPKEIIFETWGPIGSSIKEQVNVNKYYRPLLEIINRILYQIVKFNPHGFHFFNIILHIINSFFVFLIINYITSKKKLSLAVTTLFLIHPVQSEAVACISGISNLVFAFLCLVSFYIYLKATNGNGQKDRPELYFISLLIFFLALLSKEQSVILPPLIVMYELCLRKPFDKLSAKKYWYVAGFFIVLAAYFAFRITFIGSPFKTLFVGNPEIRLTHLAIPRSLLMYLSIIFFPGGLHYYRSQDILLPYVWPIVGLSLIVIAAFIFIRRMSGIQQRWAVFGSAWFIISLLPTLNIVPLINEYSYILTSEHFLYFSIIGMLLTVAGIWDYWLQKNPNKTKSAATLVIFGVISVVFINMTVNLNSYWRHEIPLFERTLKYEKNFGRVRILLAQAYFREGRFQDSIREGKKALLIFEEYNQKLRNKKMEGFYTRFIKEINYHLGQTYYSLNDHTQSLNYFKEALKLDSEDEIIQYTIGLNYIELGDFPNAIKHYEKVIELNENNLWTMNSLALCYQEIGQMDKAERLLRIIVDQDSESVSAKENLENFLKKKNTNNQIGENE